MPRIQGPEHSLLRPFLRVLFAATKLEEMRQYLPLDQRARMLTVDTMEGSSNSVFLSCNTNLLHT